MVVFNRLSCDVCAMRVSRSVRVSGLVLAMVVVRRAVFDVLSGAVFCDDLGHFEGEVLDGVVGHFWDCFGLFWLNFLYGKCPKFFFLD